MSYTILIVDDDPLQRRLIEVVAERELGYDTIIAETGEGALEILNGEQGNGINLVLLDLVLPDLSGMEVLKAVKPVRTELPFIILTAHGDLNIAVEAMKAGCHDFIQKHENPERIKVSIQNALQQNELTQEVSRLKRSLSGEVLFSDIIGESKAIQDTITISQKAATSDIPILIKGESGVGKELFARAIHGCSKRAGKPFVAVNCGAIPENLVESTLFGHEKGSFTGAVYKSLGKFREAEGGTLFLDEIAELKPDVQVKLLRALQEGDIEPVGGAKPIKVDVRIISATHRNPKEEMKRGNFREDLYYRLNVFPFIVPPLRERGNDLGLLLNFFIKRIAAEEKKPVTGVSEEAKQMLLEYSWPGNVRQLENIVFRAIVLSEGGELGIDDFIQIHEAVQREKGITPSSPLTSKGSNNTAGVSIFNDEGQFRKMHDIEGDVIKSALEHYNWGISKVARHLGIGRSTLYRKIDEMGLEPPEKHANDSEENVA